MLIKNAPVYGSKTKNTTNWDKIGIQDTQGSIIRDTLFTPGICQFFEDLFEGLQEKETKSLQVSGKFPPASLPPEIWEFCHFEQHSVLNGDNKKGNKTHMKMLCHMFNVFVMIYFL